jgi:hypothetical protein
MKTNKIMRIASVLLVAVLLSTCVISGTFAKYVASANVTDTVSVAKWDIDFDGDNDESKAFEFDLFNTIKDSDGGDEDHVVAGKIAPGTSGDFTIKLANLSDVDALADVTFELTNTAGIPLEFKVGDGAWKATLDAKNDIELAKTTGSADIKVEWRWAFETLDAESDATAGDAADTIDGEAAAAGTVEVSVKAIVNVEQVD